MNEFTYPSIRKAKKISGNTLLFRNVAVDDAGFILSLRLDENASKHLSKVSPDILVQRQWLEKYSEQKKQAYFIIESLIGEQLGTVRLYDPQKTSFCWGSWILKKGAPKLAAVESVLMVYAYAVEYLGFSCSHFDVRKENDRVWGFHERFGATRVGETSLDYLYEIDNLAISVAMKRYERYLPEKIKVEFL